MTRPVTIAFPGVFVPAPLTADVTWLLEAGLRQARVDGLTPSADIEEVVARMQDVRDAWRNRAEVPHPVPQCVPNAPDALEYVTVTATASQLGVSTRRVRTLCMDGALRASKAGKSWSIDAASVRAYQEDRAMRTANGRGAA